MIITKEKKAIWTPEILYDFNYVTLKKAKYGNSKKKK